MFASPPALDGAEAPSPVTPWSVESQTYGEFLCAIFDDWVRHDVGRVYVQLFEVQLGVWMGMPASLCVFAETCGAAMALEHNGDVYSCDHYVYPEYKLGNLSTQPIIELVASAQQVKFGLDKRDTLPKYCRTCDVRFACNGECPKHRFLTTPDGDPGLNYLCAGYKKFFRHVDPYMRTMVDLLRANRPAGSIMQILDERGRATPSAPRLQPKFTANAVSTERVGRNDPCPCGSGKKSKKCCGDTVSV
jgi:uncharacterized protein